MNYYSYVIYWILIGFNYSVGQQTATNCFAPDGVPGVCMNYKFCEYTLQLLTAYYSKPPNQAAIESYLQRSICGYDGTDLLVCCLSTWATTTPAPLYFFSFFDSSNPNNPNPNPNPPTNTNTNTIPSTNPNTNVNVNPINTNPNLNGRVTLPTNDQNQCGLSTASHTRVVGGNPAQLNGWPWMAVLGYRLGADPTPRFQCGGTLITQRHVLTAAHCIKENLFIVRLGEYDLTSDLDGAFPIDINIEQKMQHEEYNSKLIINDIAMLKLAQTVQITDRIRPICLPVAEPLRSKNIDHYQPFLAGWGATQNKGATTNILQEVQLPIVPIAECAESYKKIYAEQIFDNRVICAGYLQGGRDACQGDSGGPLMLPQISTDGTNYYWNLIGIVSYGFECARAGFPGVYTRVSTFIPWIEQHMNY